MQQGLPTLALEIPEKMGGFEVVLGKVEFGEGAQEDVTPWFPSSKAAILSRRMELASLKISTVSSR